MEKQKTQLCSKCGRELPLSEFYYQSSRGTYTSWCKECYKERNKSPEFRQRQKEYAAIKALRMANEVEFNQKEQVKNQTAIQVEKKETKELSLSEMIKTIKSSKDFDLKEFFTPRELINALYDLGYRGELSIMVEHKLKLSHE